MSKKLEEPVPGISSEMRSAVLAVALASGAAAFTAPAPRAPAAVRFGAAMPVGASPSRRTLDRRPLGLAMGRTRGPSQLQAPRAEAVRRRSLPAIAGSTAVQNIAGGVAGLGRSVGKVALLWLASVLLFNGAAFAWGGAAAPAQAAADACMLGVRTSTGAIVCLAAPGVGFWDNAKFWGFLGAIAGWGMSLAAIKDAMTAGPELISENMTVVMIMYSFLFAWWAWVVDPRNMLLCACHTANVFAQGNQLRRLLAHKISIGKGHEVKSLGYKAAGAVYGLAVAVFGGPVLQSAAVGATWGKLSAFCASPAGPFTVHFWAPMSKWLISGASFLDLKRPTDQISIAQYSALTLTGAFFTRYALLVSPVNYLLCSVNIALFLSSAWHLGRKILADYGPPILPQSLSPAAAAKASEAGWNVHMYVDAEGKLQTKLDRPKKS